MNSPSPEPLTITVDLEANSLSCEGQLIKGRRRWEALFLASVVRRYGLPLSLDELHDMLRDKGQLIPLNRTGMKRLLGSVDDILAALLNGQAQPGFGKRRGATVGPWSWSVPATLSWLVEGRQLAASGVRRANDGLAERTDAPHLVRDDDAEQVLARPVRQQSERPRAKILSLIPRWLFP